MTTREKNEFSRLKSYVIINKPTIYEQVEEDKRRAIKRIMAIVDTQILNTQVHGHIRKSVLDSINDIARAFCLTLDRVVDKIEPKDGEENCQESTSTTTSSPSMLGSTET